MTAYLVRTCTDVAAVHIFNDRVIIARNNGSSLSLRLQPLEPAGEKLIHGEETS